MQGRLHKMTATLDEPVRYGLPVGDAILDLNPLIGKTLHIQFSGQIVCVHCHKPTKKSFNQGYCYLCFIRLAQCDVCIVKPEMCHYAAGTCREPAWGDSFCYQPHVVYLANSSGIKVGITRKTQLPTRWIDQGAVQALPVFETVSRHVAGLVEVALAQHVSDKTSWQKMLKNATSVLDLPALRDQLLAQCADSLAAIKQQFGRSAFTAVEGAEAVSLHYPVAHYPSKVTSHNPDKTPSISGVLHGIKGQYLLLDSGVINIRKYTGYAVEVTVDADSPTAGDSD